VFVAQRFTPLTRLNSPAHPLARVVPDGPQGDGGESLGGANTHEGKVRQSPCIRPNGLRRWRYESKRFVVPLPGSDSGGPASAGAVTRRGHGKTSGATAGSRSRGTGKWQERRGPERGTAGREEQDPEGRTPWTLGGRRTVIRRSLHAAAFSRSDAGCPQARKPCFRIRRCPRGKTAMWKHREQNVERVRKP
jgi:hypothetical protein